MKLMLRGGRTRGIAALGMALAFCAWLTASALIACPFLEAELGAAKHGCCPRTSAPAHCPLSKSILDCPYYVTESKIGFTETIQHYDVALPAAPVLVPSAEVIEQFQCDRLADASGLNLLIRVLRI
jgi:hypothetical protein